MFIANFCLFGNFSENFRLLTVPLSVFMKYSIKKMILFLLAPDIMSLLLLVSLRVAGIPTASGIHAVMAVARVSGVACVPAVSDVLAVAGIAQLLLLLANALLLVSLLFLVLSASFLLLASGSFLLLLVSLLLLLVGTA